MPAGGQEWITPKSLALGHANTFREPEPGVLAIETQPGFAIGQRAFLVRTPAGNVLWDCISLIDKATASIVEGLGGLAAIAISHPHYYTSMADWSAACGKVPVYLHEADRNWVVRPGDHIEFWSGERRELLPGLTLLRCGGHFAGAAVLHWANGADGRGVLFCGDTLQVLPDRRHVSVMRSYPNLIPVSERIIARIRERLAPFAFDRVYGAFAGRTIESDGKAAVERSLSRYIAAIGGEAAPERELGL